MKKMFKISNKKKNNRSKNCSKQIVWREFLFQNRFLRNYALLIGFRFSWLSCFGNDLTKVDSFHESRLSDKYSISPNDSNPCPEVENITQIMVFSGGSSNSLLPIFQQRRQDTTSRKLDENFASYRPLPVKLVSCS